MKNPMSLWHDIAYRFAEQSKCQTRKVGCIIVTPDQRLIGQGYNGAPAGSDCSNCRRCTRSVAKGGKPSKKPRSGTNLEAALCAHAEANAIGYAARSGIRTRDCTLYVTTRPCSECAKLIVAAGITEVVYFEDYARDDDAIQILERGLVRVKLGSATGMVKPRPDMYPRLAELGVQLNASLSGPLGVDNDSLNAALIKRGLSRKKFSALFGCQTCGPNGMYPHDVEDVLERMLSGKLTGTQLMMD